MAATVMGTWQAKKWISRKPTTFSRKFLMPRQLQQLSCFPQQCSVDGGRVVHVLGETWTDGMKTMMFCCKSCVVEVLLQVLYKACEYTQSSHFFIHPPLVFQDLSYSQYPPMSLPRRDSRTTIAACVASEESSRALPSRMTAQRVESPSFLEDFGLRSRSVSDGFLGCQH